MCDEHDIRLHEVKAMNGSQHGREIVVGNK